MFDFCMLTARLTVKVNYILDAQNNRRFNFDTIILENIEYQTKNTKDIIQFKAILNKYLRFTMQMEVN